MEEAQKQLEVTRIAILLLQEENEAYYEGEPRTSVVEEAQKQLEVTRIDNKTRFSTCRRRMRR